MPIRPTSQDALRLLIAVGNYLNTLQNIDDRQMNIIVNIPMQTWDAEAISKITQITHDYLQC